MSEHGGKTYRPWEPQRYQHEAHSPASKLPEGDLVFFLLDVVAKLAVSRFAQFITVCSAYNLAEARHISSPVQGSSPAKTWASSRTSRAHGHHLRPSTNC